MKHTAIAFILLSLTACQSRETREADVPQVVRDAFMKKFPSAENIKWSMESEKEFEAEFKAGGAEMSANFDQGGNWLGTETEIDATGLPDAVRATIEKEFTGYDVEEAELAESAEGTFYEVVLEKEESNLEVKIAADGTVLKKEEKESEKED